MDTATAEAIERLRAGAVIATIRAPSARAAVETCDALVAGGIDCLEITYTTPSATAAIEATCERLGSRALVGAGTLLDPTDVVEAASAGARFFVSPGLEPEVMEAMHGVPGPAIPGALTPTEVLAAVRAGADLVKLFPAALGGIPYLRALRGPLPDVAFVPSGGIAASEVSQWLAAGAVAVGAGSELCPRDAIAAGDSDRITEIARQYVAAAVR